jgi:hypothetical protein
LLLVFGGDFTSALYFDGLCHSYSILMVNEKS